MTIREYRESRNITQAGLASEINSAIGTRLTGPDISRMECGVVLPTESVSAYIRSKTSEKAFANRFDARKDDTWVIMPCDRKKSLKSPVSKFILEALESGRYSKSRPATRYELRNMIHTTDRHLRSCIRELRRAGYRVCSSSDHYGYWLDEYGGGYERMRSEMIAKAVDILETVKAMDASNEGQFEWAEQRGL